MRWFKHQHYWTPRTKLNTVKDEGKDVATGGLILEGCQGCGRVRQIEFRPGESPVVRYASYVRPEQPQWAQTTTTPPGRSPFETK